MRSHLKTHNITENGDSDEDEVKIPQMKRSKLSKKLSSFENVSIENSEDNCFICNNFLNGCRVPLSFISEATETPLNEILGEFVALLQ